MTTFQQIRRKFHKACGDFSLLEDDDRVLVAISGGKDSLMLTRLLAERSRLYKPRFTVEAAHVIMDNIPYETERSYLQRFCDDLGVRLHLLHASFDESTDRRKTKCFLCSWNRRKTLFNFAGDQGFNKIALGHHQDDFITTWLMNATFEGSAETMRPAMPMRHYPVTVIRPLCLVQEDWIAEVAREENFERQKTPCPYETATRRTDINRIFHELEELNPEARFSLWRAIMASQNMASILQNSENKKYE